MSYQSLLVHTIPVSFCFSFRDHIEDIPTEEVYEEDETANEEDETGKSVQYGLGHPQYGRGMIIQKKPVSYEPVMTGKTYQQGVNYLCYR